MKEPILEVKELKKHYPIHHSFISSFIKKNKQRVVKALDGITFSVEYGDSISIVGESGCGKSTTAKTILRLLEPSSGEVIFEGRNVYTLKHREVRELRKHLQVIYQDPYEALNPKQKIVDIVREPLIANKIGNYSEQMKRVRKVLEEVGLTPVENFLERFPHELSGGQRQRVAIATAITVEPKLIIADEPISMLDISKRMDIIHLLNRLKKAHNLTLLMITHDLSIVRYLTNKTMVMYLGKIVEFGTTEQILHHPVHPYTRALVSVARISEKFEPSSKMILTGEAPNPIHIPKGCRFHTRCPFKQDICMQKEPEIVHLPSGQQVDCHFAVQFSNEQTEAAIQQN